MTLKIFTFVMIYPAAISTFQFFRAFVMMFMISFVVLNMFRHSTIHIYTTISEVFLILIHVMTTFFRFLLTSFRTWWSVYCLSSVFLVSEQYTFYSSGYSPQYSSESYISSFICVEKIFLTTGKHVFSLSFQEMHPFLGYFRIRGIFFTINSRYFLLLSIYSGAELIS